MQRLRKLYNQRHDNGKKKALKAQALAQLFSPTPVGVVSQPTAQPAAGEGPFTCASTGIGFDILRPPAGAAALPQPMVRRALPAQGYAPAPATTPPNLTTFDVQAHGEASAVASVAPDVASFLAWTAAAGVPETLPASVPSPDTSPIQTVSDPFGHDQEFQNRVNSYVVKDGKHLGKQTMAALALEKKIAGKNGVVASPDVAAALQKRKATAQPSEQPSTKKSNAASQPSTKKRKAAQGGAPGRSKQPRATTTKEPRATTTKEPDLVTVRRALNTFQIYIVYLSRFVLNCTFPTVYLSNDNWSFDLKRPREKVNRYQAYPNQQVLFCAGRTQGRPRKRHCARSKASTFLPVLKQSAGS